MAIEMAEMRIEDYEEIYALWLSTEGVGLHDYCDSRSGVAKYLERNPGLSFLARDNREVVGTVLCGHDGRRGYLHHLAVAEGSRKKGIGRTLVQQAFLGLRKIGIAKCHLFVFSKNKEAQSFWQTIGWKERSDLKILSQNIS